jgi:hypothetical protein
MTTDSKDVQTYPGGLGGSSSDDDDDDDDDDDGEG